MSLTRITGALNTLSNGAQTAINSVGGVARSVNNIAASAQNLRNATSVGGALNAINNIAGNVGAIAGNVSRLAGALGGITNPTQIGSAIRSINLPPGGEMLGMAAGAAAAFAGGGGGAGAGGGGGGDWRVKLKGPIGEISFPYTPTIMLTGSAAYDEINPTHQNYQFTFFQSGRAEQIQITAPFNVEDADEAARWVQAVIFLRQSVKMLPGGNPPPILKLSGYGDYVLPKVPVVVKSWGLDMPQDVNYINSGGTWVPVKSTLNLTLQPVYSRTDTLFFSSGLLASNFKFI